MSTLVVVQDTPETEAETVQAADDRPAVGSWWWVDASNDKDAYTAADYDRPSKKWLACVIQTGSNYAKLQGVRFNQRIALDDFYTACTAEPNPDVFIAERILERKTNVRHLMGEIQKLCHRLGVPFAQALAEAESTSTALASAHGISDVKRYQKALVKAKEKTLPDLFKQVKDEHEAMAKWMKADLIPAHAELERARGVTKVIEQKIHTVELYAGLQEQLVQVREGEPASIDEKVHLMQRRHYMDEECLVTYEAGGMNFEKLKDFDKWISRDQNLFRIFPHRRCIVAFRIRRWDKDYGDLSAFVAMKFHEADKKTFLYIRNGHQLWRMETSVDFGAQLFPDRGSHDLLGADELWIKGDGSDYDQLITGKQRAAKIQRYKENRTEKARELWVWHNACKPKGRWLFPDDETRYTHKEEGKPDEIYNRSGGKPSTWDSGLSTDADQFRLLTPENIYYDDAQKLIAQAAYEHNRVAVIVQGLLDRSTCLHPHPPWRIWTPEGFEAGIDLTYDDSKALTSGEAPDFNKYLEQLAKSIKEGSHTIGQKRAWREWAEDRYGEYRYHPASIGGGPDFIDVVRKIWRDGTCDFVFERSRMRPKWVRAERPGYMRPTYPKIPVTWRTPKGLRLFCVDAYTPGDFHMFYDDPRTRADYLKWAPFLLSAEDWHKARRDQPDEPEGDEPEESDDE